MEYHNFKLEIDEQGIAVFTANRPEKMNALNDLSWAEMNQFFTWADKADEVKVIIVTGAGENRSEKNYYLIDTGTIISWALLSLLNKYLFSNLLTKIYVFMYLKDIIRGSNSYEKLQDHSCGNGICGAVDCGIAFTAS